MANSEKDLSAYASKINEDNYNMEISMNEYQKTVEYKETLIIYVENIKKR